MIARHAVPLSLVMVMIAAIGVSCGQEPGSPLSLGHPGERAPRSNTPHVGIEQGGSTVHGWPRSVSPVPQRFEGDGLHNMFRLTPRLLSGSAPADDAAFASLGALGVTTIISVDGARPDLERAHARGMRYVHIPIGYDGVDADQQRRLVASARAGLGTSEKGAVYVHCHHGVHRGPAAAAVALIGLGVLNNEQAVAFLEAAGTSHSYPGLYASAKAARRLPDLPVADDPWDGLPEAVEVSDFTEAMADIDRVWDRLKIIRASGWSTPSDHPDLVPAAESGMIVDLLRSAQLHPPMLPDPARAGTFEELLARAISAADELETALVARDPASAERAWRPLADSCTACHQQFRNPPK